MNSFSASGHSLPEGRVDRARVTAKRSTESATVPDFFLMLNPDTEVRSGAISALVDFLDQHDDAGIAGSSFESQDGRPWPSMPFAIPVCLVSSTMGCDSAW